MMSVPIAVAVTLAGGKPNPHRVTFITASYWRNGSATPMRGKSLTCRRDPSLSQGLRPTLQNSFLAKVDMILGVRLTISRDDPCLFITAVGKNRLPIFPTEAIKSNTCGAIDE